MQWSPALSQFISGELIGISDKISGVLQSIIVIKAKTMASQFSYQLWAGLGCLQTDPTQGFIAIFSTGLSVLMFSSQQTPHRQRGPCLSPGPAKQIFFLPPLTKDFPPDTSQRFSQPGAKPARLLGQQWPRNIRSYCGAARFVSEKSDWAEAQCWWWYLFYEGENHRQLRF